MGVKALRKLQLGQETTAGTAVAATTIWRGTGTLEDQREVTFVEEDVGYLSGLDRTHIAKEFGALSMEETPATFEQLPYILTAGVEDVTTGAADGAGSGKIYEYNFPTTAARTIQTFTIEGGDDQEAEEMEYAYVESFKLSGTPGEALMMSAEWKGRQVEVSSFTTGQSVPTVEDILFSKGALYIDTSGGTIGTTAVTGSLLGMDFNCTTGWIPKWTGDQNATYFGFIQSTMPELTCDLTFEHDVAGAARKVDWRAETAKKFRLEWVGAALETAGGYTYKTLRIDFAAKVEKASKIDEMDGNDIVTVTLRPKYNATAAKFCDIYVVNNLATLT